MDQQSGWYADPDGTPGQLRWWDGDRWTDLTTSTTSTTPTSSTASTTPTGGGADPRYASDQDDAELLDGPGGVPLRGRFRGAFDPWLRAQRVRGRTSGVAVVLGVIVVLVIGLVARNSLRSSTAGLDAVGPSGSSVPVVPRPRIPPLATDCVAGKPTPAPTPSRPVPAGPRVTDFDAGISYASMGAPWQPWNQFWFDPVLRVRYGSGYYFVTQHDVGGTGADYYATVLSGSVPATAGDALHPDMPCVARQVADDDRRAFYPQPNSRRELLDRAVVIDGHSGYLMKFHLSFHTAGYNATGELVEVLVLDVGTPRVAVLYVSIPDTHRKYDPVADKVVASVSVP